MSHNVTVVLVAAIICCAVFGVIATIAVCVNADELAKAWVRLSDWWRKGGGE